MIAQANTALTMHSLGHFCGPQKGESSPRPAPSLCGGSNLGRLSFGGGGGGSLAQGLGIRWFAFGGTYWPLATAHSDPLWVQTCFRWGMGWGVSAIKAEGVCRLKLPRVCTCVPLEEGTLHLWIGGVGCPTRWIGLKREDSERLRDMGSLTAFLGGGGYQWKGGGGVTEGGSQHPYLKMMATLQIILGRGKTLLLGGGYGTCPAVARNTLQDLLTNGHGRGVTVTLPCTRLLSHTAGLQAPQKCGRFLMGPPLAQHASGCTPVCRPWVSQPPAAELPWVAAHTVPALHLPQGGFGNCKVPRSLTHNFKTTNYLPPRS